jgi:hypothetical protein
MSWNVVQGTIETAAGTSGIVTLAAGARVLQIICYGGNNATIALPNGSGGTATIPVPSSTSPFILIEGHLSRIMPTAQLPASCSPTAGGPLGSHGATVNYAALQPMPMTPARRQVPTDDAHQCG